jgi:hypothetical protein
MQVPRTFVFLVLLIEPLPFFNIYKAFSIRYLATTLTRYYYGWGSKFLQRKGLKCLSYNYFAASHGKGLCDSEGGHVKNKLAKALLSG